jgi:signal transduction histidine kinase/CheY-like chemotaxis protein
LLWGIAITTLRMSKIYRSIQMDAQENHNINSMQTKVEHNRIQKYRPSVSSGLSIFYVIIILSFIITGIKIFDSTWRSDNNFHSCIKMSGAFIAIAAGIACLIYFFGLKSRFYLIIGIGFLICGAYDFVYGLLSWKLLLPDSVVDIYRFVPVTYVTGKMFLALLIIFASLQHNTIEISTKKRAWLYTTFALIAGGSATFLVYLIPLPQFIFQQWFISRPVDFISAILFFIAILLYIRMYLKTKDIFSGMLISCLLLNFGAQIYMSFSKNLYDACFDTANWATFLSYIMPVLGISIQGLEEIKQSKWEIDARKKVEKKLNRKTRDLAQRIKILNCLYGISNIMENWSTTLDEIIQGVVNIIPPSWQFPQKTCSRVIFKGREYRSENFNENENKLSKTIYVHNKNVGSVEVFCLKEKFAGDETVFLPDEKILLREIAERLGGIIDHSEAETALHKAKDEAERASYAKSEFLAQMSHELRTPLNAILGYTEMLIEDAQDMDQKYFIPDLGKIHISGKHLLSVINDILDLAKIEAGKIEIYPETFKISKMIKSIYQTSLPLADNNKNTLEVNCLKDPGTMYSDQIRIIQILLNLLSNACKFTHNGSILIDIDSETDAENEEWIIFRIHDTGIGIEPDNLEMLFDKFAQGDSSATREYGGSGLGLTISRSFCKMLGGDISIKSEVKKGSTFTVRLPSKYRGKNELEKDLEGEKIDEENYIKETLSKKTILIIDDDPSIHDLLSIYLENKSYKVEKANGGECGLDIANKIIPDLIILDLLMPDTDGWEVLTKLKQNPRTREIPVIVASMIEDKKRCFGLGANEYILKPINRELLAKNIEKFIKHQKAYKVMIIEDDQNTREMLRALLPKNEWNIVEAENGRIALDKIYQVNPDVVILDLMMPEMDGFEFATKLKNNPVGKSIPIIALTAKMLKPKDYILLDGKIERILEKSSFNNEKLLRVLRKILQK